MKLEDDDFSLFGLPQQFAQPAAEVEQRWKQLAARVHPDRFVTEGAAAQRMAMQWALRVNEAHQRLRDPLKRAAYLCELRGAPIRAHDNTSMPSSFLITQMQWREALEEATDTSSVQVLDHEVRQSEQQLHQQLQQQLDELNDAPAAAQTVRALMFISRFRTELDRRMDALEQ
ncbi:Fe-S protein assembly co-chaperone HscB [Roseateles sp. BYS180W]|uniref:Co-chaperone protein HscB homolog n=1 Tax=Roseateles rivi TaxID=3299028 RepID=A0ABW7FZ53_9BURK